MPKINMNVWKHRVSHTCLHALREAGYRKPKDIAYVRVSSLLQIPELDANVVTSMLSALYDTIYTTRPPVSNNLSREELADAIHKICEEHDFDINPESLLALTAKELVHLTEGDEVVLPQMVRKIKHIMLGKPDPEELMRLAPVQKESRREGRWWADRSDALGLTWEEQLKADEMEDHGDPGYDCCEDLPCAHRRRRTLSAFC